MEKYFKTGQANSPKLDLPPPPPYSSLDTKTSINKPSSTFADRIRLFDNQPPNPDILSILIIVILTTANPDTKELTLSKWTIPTLVIDHDAVIKPLKRGLKRQDPHRAAEWDKLDIFLLRELCQHILSHQDHPHNTYNAWLTTCSVVRPCYRGLGKGWWYGCTIGVARVVANLPKLERLRKEKGGVGEKSHAEFRALWTQFFGAEWVKRLEEERGVTKRDGGWARGCGLVRGKEGGDAGAGWI